MTISGYLKLLYSMSLLNRFLNCFPAFQLDLWPTKLTENSICWGLLPSIQMWWAHSLWHQRSLKETDPHIFNNSIAHSHCTMTRCHVKKSLLQLRAPCQWDLWFFFSIKNCHGGTRVEDFMMIFSHSSIFLLDTPFNGFKQIFFLGILVGSS